jgi:hypothetical protein
MAAGGNYDVLLQNTFVFALNGLKPTPAGLQFVSRSDQFSNDDLF